MAGGAKAERAREALVEKLKAALPDINDAAICIGGREVPVVAWGQGEFMVFHTGREVLILRRTLGIRTFAGSMPKDNVIHRISQLIQATRGKHQRHGRCGHAPFTITVDGHDLKVAPVVRPEAVRPLF